MVRSIQVDLSPEQILQNELNEDLEHLLLVKYAGLSNYIKSAILDLHVLSMNEAGD